MRSPVVGRARAHLAVLLVAVGGCVQLLGDFETGKGSQGSASSAGGGGGGGATSSGTLLPTTDASSSASGGGASAGGGDGGTPCEILHPGGGTCEYLPGAECGCEANQKCSVIDEATGESGCLLVGAQPLPVWSKCLGDTDCAPGTWCDSTTQVCKPICNGVNDCAPGAQCLSAKQQAQNQQPVPGLKLCTAHCDPQSASPCGPNVTCAYFAQISGLDCVASQKKTAGSSCAFADDCDKGLACVAMNGGQGTCTHWCEPIDEILPSSFCVGKGTTQYCSGLDTSIDYNGKKYGVCIE